MPPVLSSAHYERLAAFRAALRQFQRFSQAAAAAAGLTPQQHQTLLAIKGHPGAERISVGLLAEQLQLRPHSALGLVERLGRRGLVLRAPAPADRRRVQLRLSARGEALIARLSAAHLQELRQMGPRLRELLAGLAE